MLCGAVDSQSCYAEIEACLGPYHCTQDARPPKAVSSLRRTISARHFAARDAESS